MPDEGENQLNQFVENSIIKTFKNVVNLKNEYESYNKISNEIKIIYPKYRNKEETRISEQEIKQIFLKVLNTDDNNIFFYSVETPTFQSYRFTGMNPSSGNTDVCLYTLINNKHLYTFKRTFSIEFKANDNSDCENDFEKLARETANENKNSPESIESIFIHIIDASDLENYGKVIKKYRKALNKFIDINKNYSNKSIITNSKNNFTIYLLTLNNSIEKIRFKNKLQNKSNYDFVTYNFINDDSGYFKFVFEKGCEYFDILSNFENKNYKLIKNY